MKRPLYRTVLAWALAVCVVAFLIIYLQPTASDLLPSTRNGAIRVGDRVYGRAEPEAAIMEQTSKAADPNTSEHPIIRAPLVGRIRIQDEDQQAVDCTPRLVQLDSSLLEQLSRENVLQPAMAKAPFGMERVGIGEFDFVLPNDEYGAAVFARVPGYYAVAEYINPSVLAEGAITITLISSPPMRILVRDESDAPIRDATVIVRGSDLGLDPAGTAAHLLRARGYEWKGGTDAEGSALLEAPAQVPMMIHVIPPSGLASATLWGVEYQPVVTLTCFPPFTISGTVLQQNGESLPDALVSVVQATTDRGEFPLATVRTSNEGKFRFEALPADRAQVFIQLHEPEYLPVRSALLSAHAGSHYEVELRTESSDPVLLKLVTNWGAPVANCPIVLQDEDGARIPLSTQTDRDGQVILTDAVARGRSYWISINTSGYWLPPQHTLVPYGEASWDVVMDRLAELKAVATSIDDVLEPSSLIQLFPQTERLAYCAEVKVADLPALMPAGDCELVLLRPNGGITCTSTHLPEGPDISLSLDIQLATLVFQLPDGICADIQVNNSRNTCAAVRERVSGKQSLDLETGMYYLCCALDSGCIDVGPFILGPEGVDLGILDTSAVGQISGRVTASAERPLSGIEIRAISPTGYRTPATRSDHNGHYTISGVPAGQYEVTCFASDLAATAGGIISRAVFLGALASVEGVDFSLDYPRRLVATLSENYGECEGGFLLCESGSEIFPNIRGRRFTFSAINGPSTVGFWGTSAGGVWIVAEHFPVLDSDVAIQDTGMSWVDVYSGRLALEREIINRIRIDGLELPIRDFGQRLRHGDFGSNVLHRLQLGARNQQGEVIWTGVAPEARSRSTIRVRISDLHGNAVSCASVSHRASGNRTLSHRDGSCLITAAVGDWVWIDHSAYWASQVQLHAPETQVVLRATSSVREIAISPGTGIVSATISPQFELGYELEVDLTRSREESDVWLVPECPEGAYEVRMTLEDGSSRTATCQLPGSGVVRLAVTS